MKKSFLFLFSFFFIAKLSLFGGFLEISSLEELYPYLQPNCLICLNIDNTLIHYPYSFASSEREHDRRKELLSVFPDYEAIPYLYFETEAIVNLASTQLVDENIPFIIKEIQNQNIPCIGVSNSGVYRMPKIVYELDRFNISFKNNNFHGENFIYPLKGYDLSLAFAYYNGILFVPKISSESSFFAFLKKIQKTENILVYVDNKKETIEEMNKLAEKEDTKFIGIRYVKNDQNLNKYNKEVAKIQFIHLKNILSNETVEKIINIIKHP